MILPVIYIAGYNNILTIIEFQFKHCEHSIKLKSTQHDISLKNNTLQSFHLTKL